jgi:hypothetical protein
LLAEGSASYPDLPKSLAEVEAVDEEKNDLMTTVASAFPTPSEETPALVTVDQSQSQLVIHVPAVSLSPSSVQAGPCGLVELK